MKAFVWRIVYAAVGVFIFWLLVPPFLSVIGLPVPADLLQLIKIGVACIALLYVLYPSQPPMPW